MSDLTRIGARALRDRIAARQVSAVEAVGAHLERAAAVDARLGAFTLIDERGARAQAAAQSSLIGRPAISLPCVSMRSSQTF